MVCVDCLPMGGELLSSWLYRQSMVSKYTPLGREELNQLWLAYAPGSDFDPDFSLNSSFANAACDAVSMSRELRAEFVQPPSSWLIPRFYRRTFCYQCLAENIRTQAFPTALKKWYAVASVVCEFHGLPLIDAAETFGPKLNMAMKFFEMHNLHRDRFISASRLEEGVRAIKSLMFVQSMLKSFEVTDVAGQLNNGGHPKSKWTFSKFLICLLLYPKFGLINRHIRNGAAYIQLPLFQQTFTYGPLIASVAHRRAALLMLGWLFEVLPKETSGLLEDLLSSVGSVLGFSDAYGVGYACNGFTPEQAAVIARRLMQWHAHTASRRIHMFIEGFVASTGK